MAILTYTTNLTAWFRGESFDTAAVVWRDMIGIKDLSVAVGSPSLITNDFSRPYVHFDGSSYLDSATNMSSYITVGAGTVFAVFKVWGAITGTSSGNPGLNECVFTEKTNGYAGIALRDSGSGVLAIQGFNVPAGFNIVEQTLLGTVGGASWIVASWRHDSNVRLAQNDPSSETSTASAATAALSTVLRVGANASASKMAPINIAELLFYNISLATDPFQQVFNYLLEEWGSRGDPLEQARDIASRRLLVERKPVLFVSYEAPLEFLNSEIGTDIQISNELGLRPNGQGWGDKTWQRGTVRLMEEEFDLDSLSLKHTARDLRETAVPIYSTFEPLPGDQPRRRGGADARAASWRTAGGASEAWVADPGSGLYIKGKAFSERVAGIHWIDGIDGGLLCEGKVTNRFLRSSFVSGTTGWTFTGTGTSGRTATAVMTTPLFFDPVSGGTANALEFNQGTVAAAQLSGATAAISVAAGEYLRLIVASISITGSAPVKWRIKRAIDNFYWDDGTGLWGAGSIWNIGSTLEVRSDGIQVNGSRYFNVGASATTLTIDVGFILTTANAINRVFHVQLQDSPCYTSPIVTNTTIVSREAQGSSIGAVDGLTIWPAPSWTLLTEVIPAWDAADLTVPATATGITKNIVTSSPVLLGWKAAAGFTNRRWEFAGATQTADPARGTRYRIAGRIAVNGDLNLSSASGNGITSIFVDGVKGTDSFYTGSNGTPGIIAFLGQDNFTDTSGASVGGKVSFDGYILRLSIRPYAMTDEECVAWTLGG